MARRSAASRRRWWLVWDPAGLMIATFAWCVIAVALWGVLKAVDLSVGLLSPLGALQALWFLALFGMVFWSHLVVLTTNPGTVPASLKGFVPGGAESEDDNGAESEYEEVEDEMPLREFEHTEDDGSLLVFCDECNFYRPSRAMHCDTCERCVILHDHHCPWVNNCVGIGNHKAFLLLLLYVSVTSFHAVSLVLLQYLFCSKGLYWCGFNPGQVPGKLGLWLAAAASVFGLFCGAMLAMELYSIYLDPIYSIIAEQLAARGGSKSKSRLERHLSVICGTDGFRTSWLLPRPEVRALHEIEIVQGFRCSPEDLEIC